MWYIISKTAGKYAKILARNLGIIRLKINRSGVPPLEDRSPTVICYGFAGDIAEEWFANISRVFPREIGLKVYNRHIVANKYTAVQQVTLQKPVSKRELSATDRIEDYIIKRQYSMCGRGIKRATSKERITGMYYQQFIDNRPYELRVHAFKWLPKEEWMVVKRMGLPDRIAWNHARGGRYISVRHPEAWPVFGRAKDMAAQALEELGMDFGSVDFVLDADKNIYFLEVNSATGWTNLSEHYYLDTFRRLMCGLGSEHHYVLADFV